ncbi:MAG: endonuclease/exonuclease/phosphatase family protein [Micrococcaceae bacterium]|nr:endonuclease/exonuclease/phosphatase family protein [Micrococcaceae bacterium]
MQKTRPSFGVQKTVLIVATAGCLALSFASPQQAAATETSNDQTVCPAPSDDVETADTSTVETASEGETAPVLEEAEDNALRVATYDANLTRPSAGELFEELSAPGTEDATEVANVIQTVRPDVLVLTGIDIHGGDELVDAFNTNYLAVGQGDNGGISYPYSYTAQSNAGVESGADLDRDGTIGGPGDALGYGDFPGQSSMIIYSRYPIDTEGVRDFTSLPWSKMPDNNIPEDVTDLERDILPLASVSHWDVPVDVEGQTVHVLASSAADASNREDGSARNQDQIRFWQDYLDEDTDYITDHRGDRGPLADGEQFVIAGSLKADPQGDGPANPDAINSLLESDEITDPRPTRTLASSALGGGALPDGPGDRYHTAPSPTSDSDSYRADYVLVSSDMTVTDSGVLDTGGDVANGFFGMQPTNGANHLVWADTVISD